MRKAFTLAALTVLIGCSDQMAQFANFEAGSTEGMGFLGASARADDPDVTADMDLPFGQISRNCSVTKAQMGTAVESASGYTLYDSAPDNAGKRTHYITGFRDNCARQLSGAMVMFGDIGTHELVRYSKVGLNDPYTTIDEAYEVIKGSYCRVGRTEPCGNRIDRLSNSTSFLTIYESYANTSRWQDVLIHKGEIVAKDLNG